MSYICIKDVLVYMICFSDYPKVRGPVCFNCQQVSHPTLCDKIQVCDELQVYFL